MIRLHYVPNDEKNSIADGKMNSIVDNIIATYAKHPNIDQDIYFSNYEFSYKVRRAILENKIPYYDIVFYHNDESTVLNEYANPEKWIFDSPANDDLHAIIDLQDKLRKNKKTKLIS